MYLKHNILMSTDSAGVECFIKFPTYYLNYFKYNYCSTNCYAYPLDFIDGMCTGKYVRIGYVP